MNHMRKAVVSETADVIAFYHRLIADMQDSPYHPEWKIGIYPETEFLEESVRRGELYVLDGEDGYLGAAVLNHDGCDGYDTVPWRIAAPPEQVTVIHALGVARAAQGRGVATAMLADLIGICRAAGQCVIRLDVLKKNLPAKHLYEKAGFVSVGECRLYYEDTGWTDFYMYEYNLKGKQYES